MLFYSIILLYNIFLNERCLQMFINYAHRGASEYAPENTMSAFDMALQLRATGIELDLQMTKDGKIVIFHDNKIDKKLKNVKRMNISKNMKKNLQKLKVG